MSNTPPDKPGLYWAKTRPGRIRPPALYLVEITGEAPYLQATAFCANPFGHEIFKVSPDSIAVWDWLGEANAPKEDSA